MSLGDTLPLLTDDPVAALRSLLLLWEDTRAPELADLIDRSMLG